MLFMLVRISHALVESLLEGKDSLGFPVEEPLIEKTEVLIDGQIRNPERVPNTFDAGVHASKYLLDFVWIDAESFKDE